MQKMNINTFYRIPAGGEEHGHDGSDHNHRQPDDDNNTDDDNEENHDDRAEQSDGDRGQHAHEAAEAIVDVLGGRGGEAALQGRALLRREGQELPAVRRNKIASLSSRKLTILTLRRKSVVNIVVLEGPSVQNIYQQVIRDFPGLVGAGWESRRR